MSSWALQDAKAKLSEVSESAKREGPQVITRRGVEEVVVVPIEQWKKLNGAAKPTLLELLQSGPKFDLHISPRGRLRMRKPIEFCCSRSIRTSCRSYANYDRPVPPSHGYTKIFEVATVNPFMDSR